MSDFDVVVVGAGVVGLAIARDCARRGLVTLVLERNAQHGQETSSRNSEVIHSGLYYPPGSLKATACTAGREMLYAYCAERGVGHRRCGKLVVATSDEETASLTTLQERAASNGVPGIEWLSASELRQREPEVHGVAALWVPTTGIVDSHGLMLALLGDLESAGGLLACRTEVAAVRRERAGFAVELIGTPEPITSRCVINAAGLQAPAVAARIEGLDPALVPRTHWAKGHYFEYAGRAPFRHLVYPVPVAGGLGIHATLDLAGRVRFGPDVEWVAEVDYGVTSERAAAFYAAVRRYWPSLPDDSLTPGYAGVRPKLVGPGAAAADFRIDDERAHDIPGLVCLYGIESPGLTSALSLAATVSRQLIETLQ